MSVLIKALEKRVAELERDLRDLEALVAPLVQEPEPPRPDPLDWRQPPRDAA